ncbi:helix-turn-helix family protein [Clostridium argentinense CDC 2741]|uniref:Helix-turn-helix family protein n=2 Tax=Clostridium argentinense TaxID=29341 RepID=A0A0C1QW35_9CLOT|nr:winged helix-turn-helix transcriptional regulator [Clostridium argentinense]ARC83113.1 hypothetical protein RSJ17_00225 [Clostridium argentinense]KIE45207.1 helix-turn-helix family protein [Clostridium argentinense CDC 2741]NFF41334.1 winged helix-turn-helix transcriptional regulator [Clostridium argentinense]NFP51771.1 winged helix-turn-helix transcriptional regulator [Clostridium argentinense]NFP74259.1 winged helix-turn-helix transcriptional regulator [Clostridium argentinense]
MLKSEIIINFYKSNPTLTNKEIAEHFNVSPQYVSKILKGQKENVTQKITQLYFEKKMSITEIHIELNVSMPTIRKILKLENLKFVEEKRRRKEATQEKRKLNKKNTYMTSEKRLEDIEIMAQLKRLQAITAKQDSRSRKLSTEDMVKQNLQHYKYNIEKERLELDMNCSIPTGIPKKYSVKQHIVKNKTYTEGIDGTQLQNTV